MDLLNLYITKGTIIKKMHYIVNIFLNQGKDAN